MHYEFYMVTINGHKFKGAMSKKEAEKMAEYYQGHSATYGGHKRDGLLKHRDFGDHVEVKRDKQTQDEFNEAYDRLKYNQPQRYVNVDFR